MVGKEKSLVPEATEITEIDQYKHGLSGDWDPLERKRGATYRELLEAVCTHPDYKARVELGLKVISLIKAIREEVDPRPGLPCNILSDTYIDRFGGCHLSQGYPTEVRVAAGKALAKLLGNDKSDLSRYCYGPFYIASFASSNHKDMYDFDFLDVVVLANGVLNSNELDMPHKRGTEVPKEITLTALNVLEAALISLVPRYYRNRGTDDLAKMVAGLQKSNLKIECYVPGKSIEELPLDRIPQKILSAGLAEANKIVLADLKKTLAGRDMKSISNMAYVLEIAEAALREMDGGKARLLPEYAALKEAAQKFVREERASRSVALAAKFGISSGGEMLEPRIPKPSGTPQGASKPRLPAKV